MSQSNNGGNNSQQQFNSQDIVANLRFLDKWLVKIADFFLENPFLSTPILWKIIIVLMILALPIQAIAGLITIFATFISVLTGNVIGIITAVLSLGYLLWLAKTTLFNPESDFKLTDLRGWSKASVVSWFIYMLVDMVTNVFTRTVPGLIQSVITVVIFVTITMYTVPFFARYFYGVLLDNLPHHPDSKFSTKNATSSEDSAEG